MEVKYELLPGDLLWADRSVKGFPYNHCGIYEGAGYVIHFASPEGSEISQENAIVHQTTFEKFKDGCPVKVIEIEGCDSPEETLRRARSFIGTKGYDFTTNNCDHFATMCKTGKHRSLQVDEVKEILQESGIGGFISKLACKIHTIVEVFKAPRLDTVSSDLESEIEDCLETNSVMSETIPPFPDEEQDVDFVIIEEEPGVDEVEDDDEPLPPAKKAWYEKTGEVIKELTYPIAAALEFLQSTGKIPALEDLDFPHLGAKVRNVIDSIVTTIKVFTGRITKEEAIEERLNNEAALAGTIFQQKQRQPVADILTQTFGKIGSMVKHIVQQAVTEVIPAPVRKAIKAGAIKIGLAIANKVKSFLQKAKQGIKSSSVNIRQKFQIN